MYTDEELHKLCDEAMQRGDEILAAAIVAVALAHGLGKDAELLRHLMRWNNTQMKDEWDEKKGVNHGYNPDPAAIDPDAIYQL